MNQGRKELPGMDPATLRIICAALALGFGIVLVLRRRGHKAE
jgi:hypothetical protein